MSSGSEVVTQKQNVHPRGWVSRIFLHFFPKLVTLLCIRHTVYQYYTQLPVLAIHVLAATFRSESPLLG